MSSDSEELLLSNRAKRRAKRVCKSTGKRIYNSQC